MSTFDAKPKTKPQKPKPRPTRPVYRSFLVWYLLPALAVTVLCCASCTSLEGIATEATSVRVATTQAVADLDTAIAQEKDPKSRVALEKMRAILLEGLVKTDRLLVAVEAIASGDQKAIQDAASGSGIPYAGASVAVAFALWNAFKRLQMRKQLEQVVKSVEEAFPDKTEEQKLKLSSVQDADTQATVEKLKN